jgi:ABC-type bacteriocin/lantibiotic exporter with double-glycine peptidase domain
MALGTLTCAILSTLMVLVFPAVTTRLVDEVLNQHHAERLMPLVLTAALAFVLQNGLSSLRIILNNTFEQRVIFDLRSDLYSHIQMLPLRCSIPPFGKIYVTHVCHRKCSGVK